MEVDLDALVANVRALAGLCSPGCKLAPVVKADAYGHGAVRVARALCDAGVGAVCVATLDEGLELRAAGLECRIIVLFEVPPAGLGEAIAAGIEPSVGTEEGFDAVLALTERDRKRLDVQLKLDTGMSRQGLRFDRLEQYRGRVTALAGSVRGVWTHLADGADPRTADEQLDRFDAMVDLLRTWGVEAERHASSSSAILTGRGTGYEMARPGLAVYGVLPDELYGRGLPSPVPLRPVMAVRARPSRLMRLPRGAEVGYGGTHVVSEQALVALFPLGYADGMRREMGNGRSDALHAGHRSPIVGRVSMDSCSADVTAVAAAGTVDRDSVFTIVGSDGSTSQTAEDLARIVDTVPHDVLVGFGQRLPRLYSGPTS